MGFFGRSTAGDIPGRPRDPSCSRADVRLQLLVFSGRVVRDIGVCGGFVSTEDETSDQQSSQEDGDQNNRDGDCGLENADGNFVPGLFSLGADPVCGASGK